MASGVSTWKRMVLTVLRPLRRVDDSNKIHQVSRNTGKENHKLQMFEMF